jgi:RNA polymerase sigma-70 factor, ECF subfamily
MANRKNIKKKSGNMKNSETTLSNEEFVLHIRGCTQNKRESQKKIYGHFYQHAIVICDSYAATDEEAVEILNQGFLKIFKQMINHAPAYINEISSFLDWLQKMMADEAIEHYTKQNKYRLIVGLPNKIYSCPDLIKTGLRNYCLE